MAKNEIQDLLDTFADGSGYGDPEARRNAEFRLQTLIAREQQRTASKLNWLTFFLVVVGILQVVILAFQVWHK
jgi:hypothetical protein